MTAITEVTSRDREPDNRRRQPVSIAWKQDGFTRFDFSNGTALTVQTNQAAVLGAITSSPIPPTDEDLQALLTIKQGGDPKRALRSALDNLQEKLEGYETDCSLQEVNYRIGDNTRVGWVVRSQGQETEELVFPASAAPASKEPAVNGYSSASDALFEFAATRATALQPSIPEVIDKSAVDHSRSSAPQNSPHPDTQGTRRDRDTTAKPVLEVSEDAPTILVDLESRRVKIGDYFVSFKDGINAWEAFKHLLNGVAVTADLEAVLKKSPQGRTVGLTIQALRERLKNPKIVKSIRGRQGAHYALDAHIEFVTFPAPSKPRVARTSPVERKTPREKNEHIPPKLFTSFPPGEEIGKEGTKMRQLYDTLVVNGKALTFDTKQLVQKVFEEELREGKYSEREVARNLSAIIVLFNRAFSPRNLHILNQGSLLHAEYTVFCGTKEEAKELIRVKREAQKEKDANKPLEMFSSFPPGEEIGKEGTKIREVYDAIVHDGKPSPETTAQLIESLYGEAIRRGDFSEKQADTNLTAVLVKFRRTFGERNLQLINIGVWRAPLYTMFLGPAKEAEEFVRREKNKIIETKTPARIPGKSAERASRGGRRGEIFLEPGEETEIVRREDTDFSGIPIPAFQHTDEEADALSTGWDRFQRSIAQAEKELDRGIDVDVSPARGEVEINGKLVTLSQGDLIILRLMVSGSTRKQILSSGRFANMSPETASGELDHAYSRIIAEIRWANAHLVSQRRDDGETVYELSREKPQPKGEKNNIPTLADRIGLKISKPKIVLNSSRDRTQFDIEHDMRTYSVILDKWEAVIFDAYFRSTKFPTFDELINVLPKNERGDFGLHLRNLNEKLGQRLLLSLGIQTRVIDGKNKRFIVPEKVKPKPRIAPVSMAPEPPTATPVPLVPAPAKLSTRRQSPDEIADARMSIKDVIANVTRTDEVDPRKYEGDDRIYMRLIESLSPSEAKTLLALAGTSVEKAISISAWAGEANAVQLMRRINPSIHSFGLRVCITPTGRVFLDDFIAESRPKPPKVET